MRPSGDPHDSGTDHWITKSIEKRRYRRALELISRAYGAQVGRLCHAMLGDQSEAEELTQEILLAAFKAMPSFEGRSQVRTWLYTIARRTCSRALKRRRRRDQVLAVVEHLPTQGPRDPGLQIEQRRQLRRGLAELPEGQRDVLLLRHVVGLSYREIAGVCECSEEAARQRASSALRRLRGAMGQEPRQARRPAVVACQELSR